MEETDISRLATNCQVKNCISFSKRHREQEEHAMGAYYSLRRKQGFRAKEIARAKGPKAARSSTAECIGKTEMWVLFPDTRSSQSPRELPSWVWHKDPQSVSSYQVSYPVPSTDEKTKAQRGGRACPKPQRESGADPEAKFRIPIIIHDSYHTESYNAHIPP